jgi:hypothetical protein
MNRLHKAVFKTLLVSLLTTGGAVYAGTATAGGVGKWIYSADASDSLLDGGPYVNRDKRPYVRKPESSQQGNQQQLEKGEFARFEEKPAVTGQDRQSSYRYVPGRKPPYERIP